MKNIILFLFLVSISILNAQNKPKSLKALRISEEPSIDGKLDESFWNMAENASDFVMFEPGDGNKERETKKTIVKVAYNDEAIFFGAILTDDEMKRIPMQFGGRDQFGNVDFFLISINPNNDFQNDTEFAVMSTGAQGDAKVNGGREDFSWNAVWDSQVTMNDTNWIIEIKIPYSALRFSNAEVQTWGINFHRRINYLNEQYSWNYIDKKTGIITQYSGELTGITNIEPPTRLNFSPYASVSNTTFDGDSSFEYNYGMDLKYGINESFTLDATLIPDFGQTAFDDQVLNLGPFEQQYKEKRAFFTEGTELFDKGNLFYSRRIGNTPVGYDDVYDNLNSNESVIENPTKVNMINALKISGRTESGLGIGVFNAITEKTSARILNSNTDEIRKMVTEPLTNYNVLVFDQQFNKNSSVSFINTSVLRSGYFRDANSSALLFDVSDKKNKYNSRGSIKMSSINEDGETTNGYSAFLRFQKTFGKVQYGVGHWRADDQYDINDLGFQRQNNYANYFANISYQIFEPTKTFNKFKISLESTLRYRNKPNDYVGNEFEFDSFFVTTNRFAFGLNMETNIGSQYDFYEPRVENRYFKQQGVSMINPWFSTDYRKKFAVDLRVILATRYQTESDYVGFNISPRYRFSDKFELIYALNYANLINEKGYVDELNDGSIIFGNRDVKTFTNSVSSKFSFNTKSSLALTFRHYWSPVAYGDTYFTLNENGTLDANNYQNNNDLNYNIWNLDLSYSWEFAPGSQLIALYRNSIFNEDNLAGLDFKENIDNLFNEPILNNFSLKFIYYLDYNKLKTWI